MKKLFYILPLLLSVALATATPLRSGPVKTAPSTCSSADLGNPLDTGKLPVSVFKM